VLFLLFRRVHHLPLLSASQSWQHEPDILPLELSLVLLVPLALPESHFSFQEMDLLCPECSQYLSLPAGTGLLLFRNRILSLQIPDHSLPSQAIYPEHFLLPLHKHGSKYHIFLQVHLLLLLSLLPLLFRKYSQLPVPLQYNHSMFLPYLPLHMILSSDLPVILNHLHSVLTL